jgi:hypothetical protein
MGLARDLTRLELSGRDWSHGTVVVTDESGHQVLSMPISQNPRD